MVGLIHAIGHSLGGLCHIPHGQAMMLLLPHCVHFNRTHGYHQGLYGELLGALKPDLDTARLTAAEKDALFETELFSLNDFFRRIYGVPTKLSEMGISRKELAAVAKQARYDGAALYNKQEITEEVAFTILEAAY